MKKGDEPQPEVSGAEVSDEETSSEELDSADEVAAEEVSDVEGEETDSRSDEEWFKSLNIKNKLVFLIFNDITGERNVIESGLSYTLKDGDKLAYWYPLDWKCSGMMPANLYVDTEGKFDCIFINLNYENISENTELILYLEDADGNDVPANIYLSK